MRKQIPSSSYRKRLPDFCCTPHFPKLAEHFQVGIADSCDMHQNQKSSSSCNPSKASDEVQDLLLHISSKGTAFPMECWELGPGDIPKHESQNRQCATSLDETTE
jgi:hypothetical protein